MSNSISGTNSWVKCKFSHNYSLRKTTTRVAYLSDVNFLVSSLCTDSRHHLQCFMMHPIQKSQQAFLQLKFGSQFHGGTLSSTPRNRFPPAETLEPLQTSRTSFSLRFGCLLVVHVVLVFVTVHQVHQIQAKLNRGP